MKNKYTTSNGKQLSQGAITSRLRNAYQSMPTKMICEGCGRSKAVDHDHTISQKRCKELGKTELIWDEDNISFSCRNCHMEWEGYKSGKFTLHTNMMKRLKYIAKHDHEGFIKRLMFVSEEDIQKQLNALI